MILRATLVRQLIEAIDVLVQFTEGFTAARIVAFASLKRRLSAATASFSAARSSRNRSVTSHAASAYAATISGSASESVIFPRTCLALLPTQRETLSRTSDAAALSWDAYGLTA